jgi:hypothetical protein
MMRARTSTVAALSVFSLAFSGSLRAQDGFPSQGLGTPRRWLQDLNSQGIFFKPGSFAEGAGIALPVAYWKPDLGGPRLDFFASAARSTRGNDYFEVRLGRVPHRPGRIPPRQDGFESLSGSGADGSRFFLYARALRREVDQQVFLGGGTPWTSYGLRDETLELVGGYQLGRHWGASARVGYVDFDLDPASSVLPSAGGTFFRVGAELAFDDRDEPLNPHAGGFLSLSLAHHDGRAGAPISFQRATMDARRFLSLGSHRHVLALRALGSADLDRQGGIPFYLQQTLGGSFTLRGYDRFRFRGTRLLTVSGEYRFELLPFLELAALYDAGRAWGGPAGEDSGLRASYGLGLRLKTSRCVLLRLDAARGDEGPQVHVKFGYSF